MWLEDFFYSLSLSIHQLFMSHNNHTTNFFLSSSFSFLFLSEEKCVWTKNVAKYLRIFCVEVDIREPFKSPG